VAADLGGIDQNSRESWGWERGAVKLRAIAAQLEPAAEIHWFLPCGKPLSRYGWKG